MKSFTYFIFFIFGYGILTCQKYSHDKDISNGYLKPEFICNDKSESYFKIQDKVELPDCVADATHIKGVSLSNLDNFWPKNLFKIKTLEYLEIVGNYNFNYIPSEIGSLKNLKVINFANGITKFKEIPKELGYCTNLEEIKFFMMFGDESNITSLPKELGNLKNIKDPNDILRLGYGSKVNKIPAEIILLFKNEPKISILDYNTLMELPNEICDIVNLRELVVNRCWQLTQIPQNIGNLKKLKILSLSNSEKLSKLPNSLGNLENLEELDLSNCGLTELPSSIGKLKNLKRLYLEGNKLTKLPDSFWKLNSSLEELNIKGNKLSKEIIKKVFDKFFQVKVKF